MLVIKRCAMVLAVGVALLFAGSASAQPGALDYAAFLDGTGTLDPIHMVVDSGDNVFVAGYFSGTIDFDPGVGTAFHTGTTDLIGSNGEFGQGFVAKYDPDGNLLFAKTVVGYGNIRGGAVAIASNGDILVAGQFETATAVPGEELDFDPGAGVATATSPDKYSLYLLRLDGAGDFISVQTWSSSGVEDVDFYRAMVIDGADNIYLGGAYGAGEQLDVDPGPGISLLPVAQEQEGFVFKLDASGNLVYGHAVVGTFDETVDALALDGSGNLYIAGTFQDTIDVDPGAGVFNLSAGVGSATAESFLIKLDPNGVFVDAINFIDNHDDTLCYSNDMKVDVNGNVYLTGAFRGNGDFDPGAGVVTLSSPGDQAMFALKLDASFGLVYARQFGGLSRVRGYGVHATAEGTAYYSGLFRGTVDFDPDAGVFNMTAANTDGMLIRLDADGTFNYALQMSETSNGKIASMAMDSGLQLHYMGDIQGTMDADPDGASTVPFTATGSGSGILVKFDLEPFPPVINYPYVASIAPYTILFNQTVPVFLVEFSEPVSGVDASDFVISGTAGASVFGVTDTTGAGTSYAVGLSMNPVQGEVVTLAFVDDDSVLALSDSTPVGGVGAGNGNFSSGVVLNINYPGITNDTGNIGFAFTVGNPALQENVLDVMADEVGNVYVVGSFEGTVDLDPGAGVVTLTSTGDRDAYIAKYSATGNLLFARSFGGAGREAAYKVGRDRYDGSLYIYGRFEGTADFDPGPGTDLHTSVGLEDLYLLKLDQNGDWLETHTFGATYSEYAGDMVVDSRGYVFIGGTYTDTNFDADPGAGVYSFPPADSHGIFLIALDDEGLLRFAYHASTTNDINIQAITRDGQGRIYLTGNYTDPLDVDPTAGTQILPAEMGKEGFLIRLAYDGTLIDAVTIRNGNPAANAVIKINDVAVDIYRNVYLGGSVVGTADFDPTGTDQIYTASNREAFAVKWDRNLNLVFDSHFPSTTAVASNGEVNSVVVDRNGGILLGGEFGGPTDFDPGAGVTALTPPFGVDGFLARINADGSFGFAHQIGATVDSYYRTLHLEPVSGTLYTVGRLDGTGNFDISGSTYDLTSPGTDDIFVARYALSQPSYYQHFPLVDSFASGSSKALGTVEFEVTFSHHVTGVDVTDFVLTGTGTGTVIAVTGSGNTYQVFVDYDDATGPLFLSLYDDDSIISTFSGDPLGGVGVDNGSFLAGAVSLDKGSSTGLPVSAPWALGLLTAGLLVLGITLRRKGVREAEVV